MKGKIAFVLGAAVGYVLGSRAGRERYEQIKNGAQKLWNTAPVQRGVDVVRDAAQIRLDDFKASAARAGKNAMAAFLRDDESDKRSDSASKSSATSSASTAKGGAKSGGSTKQGAHSESEDGPGLSSKSSSSSRSSDSSKSGDSSNASKSGDDA